VADPFESDDLESLAFEIEEEIGDERTERTTMRIRRHGQLHAGCEG
jgi:hypothetical protein